MTVANSETNDRRGKDVLKRQTQGIKNHFLRSFGVNVIFLIYFKGMFLYFCICMCIFICLYICVYLYVCIYIYACVFIYIYICVYIIYICIVYMYMCVCIYICVYLYRFSGSGCKVI